MSPSSSVITHVDLEGRGGERKTRPTISSLLFELQTHLQTIFLSEELKHKRRRRRRRYLFHTQDKTSNLDMTAGGGGGIITPLFSPENFAPL